MMPESKAMPRKERRTECKACGSPITQAEGKRERIFCCQRCREMNTIHAAVSRAADFFWGKRQMKAPMVASYPQWTAKEIERVCLSLGVNTFDTTNTLAGI